MDWERIVKELSFKTSSKIVLLVLDGLGGLPVQGKTELEAAQTPNLDLLAAKSVCGLTDPVFMGITPGSGPAHLALFGYDPTKYILGRGILEALGSGVEVGKNDLVARGNFATLKDGLIIDRRAGRIPTSENKKLCQRLNNSLKSIEGTKIALFPGKEHRFVAKFTGEGLSEALSDADPQKENKPRVPVQALSQDASKTALIVNRFLDEVTDLLKSTPKTNTVLLRGFSQYPSLSTMREHYKLKPAAIANYPMYKGLAKLVGMEILETGENLSAIFETAEKYYKDYDFFYIHVKKTDSAGEDGNFEAKKDAIEEADSYIPRLVALQPDVLVVSSDHSTPSLLKTHSWHPNPFLLHSKTSLPDDVTRFSEKECCHGYLGRFQAMYAMPLMLAHAGKLKKFGA
ncbi:MAG: 2,3-bisphosphoglycerate-independent phosphoglycerate mutase [Candidatus Aminicenantes bacterium]|nr:2,3-bisphosphoglycerate-independent phosphoglycerate mutase [Candidatus Aminicenantes bacterium]